MITVEAIGRGTSWFQVEADALALGGFGQLKLEAANFFRSLQGLYQAGKGRIGACIVRVSLIAHPKEGFLAGESPMRLEL